MKLDFGLVYLNQTTMIIKLIFVQVVNSLPSLSPPCYTSRHFPKENKISMELSFSRTNGAIDLLIDDLLQKAEHIHHPELVREMITHSP